MQKYFDMLQANGADLAIKIDASTIVTAAWTIYRRQYGLIHMAKVIAVRPIAPHGKKRKK